MLCLPLWNLSSNLSYFLTRHKTFSASGRLCALSYSAKFWTLFAVHGTSLCSEPDIEPGQAEALDSNIGSFTTEGRFGKR